MKLTTEAKEKYLQHPVTCPFCQSNDIVTGEFEPANEITRLEVCCRKCGQEWTDTFKLVSITHTSEDDTRPQPTEHVEGYA